MSTISLRLPESLHNELRELSKREGISINQLAAAALGEKNGGVDDAGLSGRKSQARQLEKI